MKSQKINNYNLTGSIHTLQIKSSDIPEIPAELQECISSSTRKNHGKIEAISIINPNKLLGDCHSFTEFEQSFSSILEEVGVTDYNIMRVIYVWIVTILSITDYMRNCINTYCRVWQ